MNQQSPIDGESFRLRWHKRRSSTAIFSWLILAVLICCLLATDLPSIYALACLGLLVLYNWFGVRRTALESVDRLETRFLDVSKWTAQTGVVADSSTHIHAEISGEFAASTVSGVMAGGNGYVTGGGGGGNVRSKKVTTQYVRMVFFNGGEVHIKYQLDESAFFPQQVATVIYRNNSPLYIYNNISETIVEIASPSRWTDWCASTFSLLLFCTGIPAIIALLIYDHSYQYQPGYFTILFSRLFVLTAGLASIFYRRKKRIRDEAPKVVRKFGRTASEVYAAQIERKKARLRREYLED